jgi:2-hydroxychromene-2-carboxylate isomerase
VSLKRRVSPLASQLLTGPRTRDLRRRLAEGRRRLRREPHRVLYFHQVDDPYSHLAAQVLTPLLERYDLELVPYLVAPPMDAAVPERERLMAYSRKDAAEIAPGYGLAFRDPGRQPDAELAQLAGRILASTREGAAFAAVAARVGDALWSEDGAALEVVAREHPPAGEALARSAMASGDQRRRRLGHYLGATFHYGGEWYWGVDRLHYLERRLASGGVRRPGATAELLVPRRDVTTESVTSSNAALSLEFFPSLRSPYTYISMSRTYELARRYPVRLVLRPVLPMVMRGLPVPAAKRLYIVLDTAREAEQVGVPFGKICDPLGRPVERGYSLFPWAREQGKAEEYLLSFCRAAFGEGIDTGSDTGLRAVVERVGLRWEDAREHLDSDAWRPELEANREAMLSLGLWGVPSFRLRGPEGQPDLCTWGQDRLWLVEEEIRKRLG